jgi:MFS family permease
MNASAAGTPAAGALRTLRYAALLATYLQSVNVSIPNAVLRFIQASTSMTDDQAGWIFTSYLAATAISMPVAQWLAARFGVKTVFIRRHWCCSPSACGWRP